MGAGSAAATATGRSSTTGAGVVGPTAGPAGAWIPPPTKMQPVDTEKPCAAGASGVTPKPAGIRGDAGMEWELLRGTKTGHQRRQSLTENTRAARESAWARRELLHCQVAASVTNLSVDFTWPERLGLC